MKLFKDCGLTPIEECITKMRCGIECAPHTSGQIAAELGITRSRIRQIEAEALRKLRHGLEMKKSAAAQRNLQMEMEVKKSNPFGTDGTT